MGKSRRRPWLFCSDPGPSGCAWGALPLTLGPALGEALDERSLAVARTASALAWVAWAAVLLAIVVARTPSLTIVRIAAPAALVVAAWAAVDGRPGRGSTCSPRAWGAAVVVAAFSPVTGDHLVNGSSYGDERRMLLRVPAPLLLGPVPLAWAATVGPARSRARCSSRRGNGWPARCVLAVSGADRPAWRRARCTAWPAGGWCSCLRGSCCTTSRRWSTRCCSRGARSPTSGRRWPASDDETCSTSPPTRSGWPCSSTWPSPSRWRPRRAGGPVEAIPVEHLRFTPTRPGRRAGRGGPAADRRLRPPR